MATDPVTEGFDRLIAALERMHAATMAARTAPRNTLGEYRGDLEAKVAEFERSFSRSILTPAEVRAVVEAPPASPSTAATSPRCLRRLAAAFRSLLRWSKPTRGEALKHDPTRPAAPSDRGAT
jgi:hypothetical protein